MLPPAVIVVPSSMAGAARACSTWPAMVWAMSRAAGIAAAGQVGDQDDELIAAVAGDQIGRARRPLEPARDLAQELVARLMAVGVVDLLEVVEVDVQHGNLAPMPLGAGEREVEVLAEHEPVRQPGQVVVIGQVGHPPVGPLPGGDVTTDLGRRDHPAAGIDDRRHRQRHVHLGAVLAHAHRLEVLDRPATPDQGENRRGVVGPPERLDERDSRPIASAAVWP